MCVGVCMSVPVPGTSIVINQRRRILDAAVVLLTNGFAIINASRSGALRVLGARGPGWLPLSQLVAASVVARPVICQIPPHVALAVVAALSTDEAAQSGRLALEHMMSDGLRAVVYHLFYSLC